MVTVGEFCCPGYTVPVSAAVDGQGRLVSLWNDSGGVGLLLRHLPDGAPDKTFGTPVDGLTWTGIRHADLGVQNPPARPEIQLLEDGSILLSIGRVLRIMPDGSITTVFSSGRPLVHQNKLLVPFFGTDRTVGVVRYHLDGSLDTAVWHQRTSRSEFADGAGVLRHQAPSLVANFIRM